MAKPPEREKEKSKATTVSPANLTALEQICGNDKETYEALSYMFLDPRKIDVNIEQAVSNGEKAEDEKDVASARMWYQVAGGLALYQGDTKKVAQFYGEAQRVTGQKYTILNDPDKAVAKAQQYYKQYLVS